MKTRFTDKLAVSDGKEEAAISSRCLLKVGNILPRGFLVLCHNNNQI